MNFSCFQKLVFLLFITPIFFIHVNAQTDTIKYDFGIYLNGNFGSLNPFNKDPQRNIENGQDYLERAGGAFEKGAELLFFHKSGLCLRAHTHSAKSIFKEINRGIENDLKGTWSGNGKNIGIGYGEISKIKGRDFQLFLNIGYGSYRSEWNYFNEDNSNSIFFGNQEISPNTKSAFSSKNSFLDFNAFFGRPKPFKGGKASILWNHSLSIGYRHSLDRSDWKSSRSNEQVSELNPTRFIAWYFTYSFGIGYLNRNR